MNSARQGALFALGAYGLWGGLPIYLRAVAAATPAEILIHRIVWSLLFLLLLLGLAGRLRHVAPVLAHRRQMLTLLLSAVLLSVNWLLYIWAVNNDRILSASLGYFINPLVNVALGLLVLQERLRPAQWAAVALAATGIALETLAYGEIPWIALILASSFGLYGMVRKRLAVDPGTGLLVETALMTPPALLALACIDTPTANLLHNPLSLNLMLLAAGPVTAVPLLLFSAAAKRLDYSTLGMFQYLAPSLMFALAVGVYGEPLDPVRLRTFVFIWLALLVYSVGTLIPVRQKPA